MTRNTIDSSAQPAGDDEVGDEEAHRCHDKGCEWVSTALRLRQGGEAHEGHGEQLVGRAVPDELGRVAATASTTASKSSTCLVKKRRMVASGHKVGRKPMTRSHSRE